MIANLRDPQQLCDLLNAFFSHTEPAHEDFNKAVDEFKQRVPDLARGLVDLISQALNEVRLGAQLMSNNVSLLDHAMPPRETTHNVSRKSIRP